MDWSRLKDAIESICRETIRADKSVFANLAIVGELLDFIPADPNKKADAEWLKERGWNRIGTSNTWRSPCGGFMMGPSGWYDFVLYGEGRMLAGDPTLMTVALFEAAAMEAMKHGE